MTTFNKAGITEVPKSLDDLMAAGKAFKEKLGDDYYPMHLGAYDRMILMVFYLESKYGKDWADPSTSTLNYDADQIAEGIDFIKSLVEGHVIMSLPTQKTSVYVSTLGFLYCCKARLIGRVDSNSIGPPNSPEGKKAPAGLF